jgi:hypothetical protein
LLIFTMWSSGAAFIGWTLIGRPRPPIPALAAGLMLAGESLFLIRLVPLFVAAAVTLLAPLYTRRLKTPLSPLRTAFDLAATGAALIMTTHLSIVDGCIRVSGNWTPDADAVRALRASGAHGRLITGFDWGEYALWHLSPALKISYDGRRETVYSRRTMDQQRAIEEGDASGMASLGRLSPEYVWLSDAVSGPTKAWVREHGYRIDVDTGRSFVAVRNDLPVVPTVGGGTAGCFPAP